MKLSAYIALLGDEKAAQLWSVKVRTVQSWRLGERTPRRDQAALIVRTSPVTYEGIYGPKEDAESEHAA